MSTLATAPVQLVECPRDAMQGWPHFIPTAQKIAYLNQLLKVGFHTLDCLSFVSPKAIPQMADSHEVVQRLQPVTGTEGQPATRILAIVANERGAADACQYELITHLGYPFSISPTFQQRNANSTIEQSWQRLQQIQALALKTGKEVVVYLSMAFGNPYADAYHPHLVVEWAEKMVATGIRILSLADTVGLATPQEVQDTTAAVVQAFGTLATIGVHLHSTPQGLTQKLDAALQAGATRVDGALHGYGGCPMAGNSLVGNMDMLQIVAHLQGHTVYEHIQQPALWEAASTAAQIFAAQKGSD
ncbi:MAG TPA: hydroxymethylglutaryl-CoA lyase [Phnomibacter sp.]|nr:hydroxymethylglutaryl-CoA lyase [Phnomibacter sp.]